MDLRVGIVRGVTRHPKTPALRVVQVDVGEAAPRTVVTGVPETALQPRVVALCGLRPAAMRGVVSDALLLSARAADGETSRLVRPPADAAAGARVLAPSDPWQRLVGETVAAPDGTATYRGVPLTVGDQPCTTHDAAF